LTKKTRGNVSQSGCGQEITGLHIEEQIQQLPMVDRDDDPAATSVYVPNSLLAAALRT
jgi:hypothetical protein